MPTSLAVSAIFSIANTSVTYFHAASAVAAGVGVPREAGRPSGVGAGGGSGDSESRMGTMRSAAGTGVGVSTAVGAERAAGDAASTVGLAAGVGALHAHSTAASATPTNAPTIGPDPTFTAVLPTGPLPTDTPRAQ